MLGKLGAVLNRDVGSLVKDAGKVLNADVGDIVKGAGKVLNADLGQLLKGNTGAEGTKSSNPEASQKIESALIAANSAATTSENGPEKIAPPLVVAPPAEVFDPDATIQIRKPPAMSGDKTALDADASAPQRLTDEMVSRNGRSTPQGTSLTILLPYVVGEFERPHAMPNGDLTSDPATAIYRGGGETIAVKLINGWDEDEAKQRLDEVKSQSGENVRVAADRSWVLGQTAQGIVFAWTRGTYSFSATSPKGLGPLAKFLATFPF